MNTLYLCHLSDDVDQQDALVVKIYMFTPDNVVIDRDQEVIFTQVAHAVGVGPPLYGIFDNGHVYKYAPGRQITFEEFLNPKLYRYIYYFTYFPDNMKIVP